jgi:Secretion system C-terminal sorting domain
MKPMQTIIVGFLLLISATFALAQTSNGTGGGDWNASGTWTGGAVPTGSGTITILSTDSIYFNVAVTITGTLKNQSAKLGFDTTKTITFSNGSVYEHALNGGSIPKATWSTGSTCLITGAIGNSPSNGNQNFYNLTWDCVGQTGGLNLGMSGNTIGGNVRVIRSNSAAFRLTASGVVAPKKTITINGDCLVDSSTGYLTSTGSSSPDTFTVITKGNIISYGRFDVANGSAALVNWYVAGDVKALGGTFTTNSTLTKPDSLIFNGTTKQTFVRAGSVGAMSNIMFDVKSGATVDMDTNTVGGSATSTFTLEAGGTLISGHAKGLAGNVNNGGTIALSTAANYTYDGTVVQGDSLMPTTVNNLSINNVAGVILRKPTLINSVLTLTAGVFDNTIPFTLGPGGSVVFAGGSLKISSSVDSPAETSIPQSFYVNQNYPNPFNPSTIISYGTPKNGIVTAKVYNLLGQEIATLFAGYQNAGVHSLTFDASNLCSGIYLYRIQAGNVVETKRMVVMK